MSAANAPKSITVARGDGIGPEIMDATLRILEGAGARIAIEEIEIGEAVYFSRSRQQLWHKGATSGHTQTVEKILTDCDQDALVLKVRQHGPGCCHAGYRSCFYRNIQKPGNPVALGQEIPDQSYDPDKVYH